MRPASSPPSTGPHAATATPLLQVEWTQRCVVGHAPVPSTASPVPAPPKALHVDVLCQLQPLAVRADADVIAAALQWFHAATDLA